jgi:hypothetical protein
MPPALSVSALCLVLVALADLVIRHESHPTGDEPFYLRMASHPGGLHAFPYAYRIAVPWLVHALPFSHVVSFTLLAWLATAAAGGALYVLLQDFDVPPGLALGLVVGFVLSPVLLVVLPRHGQSVDPETALVMVLGCLFIVRRQRASLAVTLLLGVAVKETSLFLIPLAYAVWAERPFDGNALREVALVAAVPIAAYAVLRASVDALGSQYQSDFTGSFLHVRVEVFRHALSGIQLRRLAYTYGPLWLVAPFALRDLRFARRGLVLVGLCLLALTVSFDAPRILFLAAPVFYLAAGWVLRNRPRLAVLTVVTLLAVDVGYGVYLQVHGVRYGLDTTVNHQISIP